MGPFGAPSQDLREWLPWQSGRQQRFSRICALGGRLGLAELGRQAERLDRIWPSCGGGASGPGFGQRQSCGVAEPWSGPPALPEGWSSPPAWPQGWAAPPRLPAFTTVDLSRLPQPFSVARSPASSNPDPAESEGVRFAINTPLFFHSEDLGEHAFGTFRQIAGDLHDLGVAVARHPGRVQIFYDELFGDAKVPVGFAQVVRQIYTHGALARSIAHLEELVIYLSTLDPPVRLIITLVTLGVGEPGSKAKGDRRANPLGLSWSADHLGNTVTDLAGRTYDFELSGEAWDLNTLDQANPYKRVYLSMVTLQVAAALKKLRDELLSRPDPIRLEDYIEGFEIGNEVETKNLVDGLGDGVGWGALYADVAVVMLTLCPWAHFFLPGLQAFDDTADELAQWGPKVTFVGDLLDAAEVELAAIGSGWTMADIVAGIDLHYYHGSSEKVRSLAYLYADVQELREVLSGYDGIVSVTESGVNVSCRPEPDSAEEPTTSAGAGYDAGCEGSGDWPYPVLAAEKKRRAADRRPTRRGCADWRGHLVTLGAETVVGANDFQGASVWMRLAVAMAAGADIVGWHTWMARLPSEFAGYGLRRDLHSPFLDVSVAEARPSWYAFRRMARFFGGATSVRRLLPDTPAIHEDVARLEPLSLADQVWVIEIDNPPGMYGGSFHAYLAFLDPFGTVPVAKGGPGDADAAPLCARLVLQSTLPGLRGWVVRVPTAPELEGLDAPPSGRLPATRWVHGMTEPVDYTTTGFGYMQVAVVLTRGAWPVLLASPFPLEVRADLLEVL